jgi:hypothetical protein
VKQPFCARCAAVAVFLVAAGDPATFWYRSECTCPACLPAARRWAGFVGPVTVTHLDSVGPLVQGTLFDLPGGGR